MILVQKKIRSSHEGGPEGPKICQNVVKALEFQKIPQIPPAPN